MKKESFADVAHNVQSEPRDLALKVAYLGAPFAGFARQPCQVTVQGQLEAALKTLLRREVETICAGRTDSGVHALGQVISCALNPSPAEQSLDLFAFRRSLEVLAGTGISVRAAAFVPAGFSARFDAVERVYRYRIFVGNEEPLFGAPFAWHITHALNVDAMRAAATYLVGEHDFTSFCVTVSAAKLRDQGLSLARNVHAIELFEEDVLGENCITIEVRGNAFLHSMVRTLVGTLVEVGLGNRAPEWVVSVLEARQRSAAGQTAPAAGLTFVNVRYPAPLFD